MLDGTRAQETLGPTFRVNCVRLEMLRLRSAELPATFAFAGSAVFALRFGLGDARTRSQLWFPGS